MTSSALNATGSPPAPERVEEIARRVLEIDTPDEPTPAWFIPILIKFLTDNPGDDHFIIELPDPAEPARGGSGYGAVTCMEDQCWSNINLSPDPEQPDGGKANGVGSLWDYAYHCREEDHIKCRNERLKRMGVVPPGRSSSSVLPSLFPSSEAGPSRLGPSHIQPNDSDHAHAKFSKFSDAVLVDSDSDIVLVDSDSDTLLIDSDSDNDIQFVGRSSPRKDIIHVEDIDDDRKLAVGSSQPQSSLLRSSQQASASNDSRRWIRVWSSMSLSDRRHAINQELRDLSQLTNRSTGDTTRAVARRRDALRSIEDSGCLMQWTPPDPFVFQAFPSLYVHPRLAETFERPKPTVDSPINLTGGFSYSTVAGPSTRCLQPVSALSDLVSKTLAFSDAVKAVWQGVDRQSRLAQLINEQSVLRQAMSRFEVNPQYQGIVFLLRDRFNSLAKLITSNNSTWLPPTAQLLGIVPELRYMVHHSLVKFLPPIPGGDGDANSFGLGEEWNRPTGPALADYFKDALADFQDDDTVEEASKVVGLSNTSDLIPGADFTLMPHQILGVAFMMKREQRTGKGGRGGMLCDAMGLGKTVQTLALMLARDERPADYERAPQLIVAPLALLLQWKEEIETKTTKNFRVYIHHGSNRLKSAVQIRNSYDIVLTTYGTLCSESGITKQKKKQKQKKYNQGGSDDDSDYAEKKKRGPLFKIHWFRVVLDEGHNVRNRRTISSRAVLQLDVLHPWILTGTPIVNSLGDVGPALEFIGAMDLSQYNDEVVKREKRQPKNASRRCQAILKPLMLRRNKDTELNGKKILELPPKAVNLAWQDFELDERAIYAAIEQRAKMRVSKFLKAGTVMKNYHVVLVLLTRLRQAANHPWLLRRKPGDEGHDGDLLVDDAAFGADLGQCRDNDEDEYGRAVAILGKPVVDALAKRLEERHLRLSDESLEDDGEVECTICMEPLDGTEVITPCSHLYCRACISNYFIQPVRDATCLTDEDVSAGCRSCPMCRSKLQPGHVFRCAAIFRPKDSTPEPSDDDDDDDIKPDIKPNIGGDRKDKKRARNAAESFFGSLTQHDSEGDEQPGRKRTRAGSRGKGRATSMDVDADAETIEEKVPPSTKLRRTLELVQDFLEEDPNTKVLIFSQFVAFLDLLSDFLKENGIASLGYRGSMTSSARDEAVRRFRTAPGILDPIPVMLISTKAGGVGLNLTMAHKVIMCDLAWNPATENQAIDRSHRIGQKRPVQVERLVIRDTVEDRLLAIQEHKGLLADGAMGEGSIGRLGRLTLDDIRKLFAINANDE